MNQVFNFLLITQKLRLGRKKSGQQVNTNSYDWEAQAPFAAWSKSPEPVADRRRSIKAKEGSYVFCTCSWSTWSRAVFSLVSRRSFSEVTFWICSLNLFKARQNTPHFHKWKLNPQQQAVCLHGILFNWSCRYTYWCSSASLHSFSSFRCLFSFFRELSSSSNFSVLLLRDSKTFCSSWKSKWGQIGRRTGLRP